MFLTKAALPRRTLLRGVGSAIALPLLEAMLPAQTASRNANVVSPSRLVCLEMVHGSAGSSDYGAAKHYWSPEQTGNEFELSYSLQPLEGVRAAITIISNTTAKTADAEKPKEVGADHFRSSAVFLTAARARQREAAPISNGISIDQVYAQHVGTQTPVPSLQLCIESPALENACGYGYDCAFTDTISWASDTRPLPMELNPRVVFERLFGRTTAGSVLDQTTSDRMRLGVGGPDRIRVNRFLEAVRAVERRIQAVERRNALAVVRERLSAPLGVPDSWEEHVDLMFELQALALEADITRVSAFKMSRDVNNRVFRKSGILHPFHSLSHHVQVPTLIDEFAKLNRYHVSFVAQFLKRLADTPDGDGSLLDHSLVLYGSPMGDSYTHNHSRLPIFLAGHANGNLRGKLHHMCSPGTPHGNTLLTILQTVGVEVDSFGDSSGVHSI
ncbi:MAG: DUF1552 domain-containing protein [Bryobacteraceae bacterium]